MAHNNFWYVPRLPLSATMNDENENKWHVPKMTKVFGEYGRIVKSSHNVQFYFVI